MTQLPVLLFASYAEAFGSSVVTVSIPDAATTADVIEALRQLPGGNRLPATPVVAVNRKYVRGVVPVSAGQEVALIPPVAGG